jgi:hypothetical protein
VQENRKIFLFELIKNKGKTTLIKHTGAPSRDGNFSNVCALQARLNMEHQAYRKLREEMNSSEWLGSGNRTQIQYIGCGLDSSSSGWGTIISVIHIRFP